MSLRAFGAIARDLIASLPDPDERDDDTFEPEPDDDLEGAE